MIGWAYLDSDTLECFKGPAETPPRFFTLSVEPTTWVYNRLECASAEKFIAPALISSFQPGKNPKKK